MNVPIAIVGRILIVEDNATSRLKIVKAIHALGHRVTTAENGSMALENLELDEYDLVILDMMMPKLDGIGVLEKMKTHPRMAHLPVIIISAVEEMESVIRAFELGAGEWLPKNFDPILLRVRIETMLERKILQDQERQIVEQAKRLASVARSIQAGDFTPGDPELEGLAIEQSYMGDLARVIAGMAREVHAREQSLKQQVRELSIAIDKSQQAVQVKSITDSSYFKDLRERANELRNVTAQPR